MVLRSVGSSHWGRLNQGVGSSQTGKLKLYHISTLHSPLSTLNSQLSTLHSSLNYY
jgi:hypothetical protein